MGIEVLLPGVLAQDAGGRHSLQVDVPDGANVGQLLDALGESYPQLGRRVRDETGALRRFVNVYVGEDDVRVTDGLATPVPAGTVVTVLPSVAGG
jgi:molybdopterin synthase sulfur carrier subunit